MICEKCKKIIPENLDYCPTCKVNEHLNVIPTQKNYSMSNESKNPSQSESDKNDNGEVGIIVKIIFTILGAIALPYTFFGFIFAAATATNSNSLDSIIVTILMFLLMITPILLIISFIFPSLFKKRKYQGYIFVNTLKKDFKIALKKCGVSLANSSLKINKVTMELLILYQDQRISFNDLKTKIKWHNLEIEEWTKILEELKIISDGRYDFIPQ